MADTWTPSSPIVVAGKGMFCGGPWSFGAAGAIVTPSGSGKRITHGDSDWVGLGTGHVGSLRTLCTSLGPAADQSCWTPGNSGNGQPTFVYNTAAHDAKVYGISAAATPWSSGATVTVSEAMQPSVPNGYLYQVTNAGSGTTSSVEPTWPTTFGTATTPDANGVVWTCYAPSYSGGARLIVPFEVHHGATLLGLTVWIIVASHVALPQNQPKLRAFSLSKTGVLTPLCTVPAEVLTQAPPEVWANNGWVQLAQPNLAAYYNGGDAYGIGYPLDSGIVIDTTSNAYFLELVDESGVGAAPGNRYIEIDADLEHIADLRPQ